MSLPFRRERNERYVQHDRHVRHERYTRHSDHAVDPMKIVPPTESAIDEAVVRLRRGELIGLPTETVYGLAGDASNVHAVANIFAVKGRPATHPVIVHLAATEAIDDWAARLSDDARKLVTAFAPGPLTLIVARSPRVPDIVTGGQDTVGLRFPSHPVARQVLQRFGGGIAAPSANRFGRISATTAQHVADEFSGAADAALQLVIDGGPCDFGIESTIVDVSGSGPAAILRPGGIGIDALARVLGYVPQARGSASPRVSGDLPSHYAPQTPTRRVDASRLSDELSQMAGVAPGKRIAVLARTVARPAQFTGLWRQAPIDAAGYARALYAELRVLDAAGVELIVVEAPPDQADWQAINDRLRRATHDTESRRG